MRRDERNLSYFSRRSIQNRQRAWKASMEKERDARHFKRRGVEREMLFPMPMPMPMPMPYALPDRMLSRLRQLHDHSRHKLQLVDPLDVIPALLLTATLLGMAASCPVEHFALLAVPFHPLETHRWPGEVAREPLEAIAVA